MRGVFFRVAAEAWVETGSVGRHQWGWRLRNREGLVIKSLNGRHGDRGAAFDAGIRFFRRRSGAAGRSVRFGALPEQVLQDVRHGLRLLVRNPGLTAATVLTLTLGIGATTTVFSVVDAVLLQPPPFPDSGRLVTLWQTDPDSGQPAEAASAKLPRLAGAGDVVRARRGDRALLVRRHRRGAAGGPVRLGGHRGLLHAAGRRCGATAARSGPRSTARGAASFILTDGLWQRRFGGDAGIVGRSLVLDGEPYTVVGVLAPDFEVGLERGRGARDLFVPKAIAEWEGFRRGDGWWHVVARLRRGVTLSEAQAEMDTVAARMAADHPRTNDGVGARVIPLQASQVEAVRPTLLLLQGLVALVLLIACINVANLMLAHGARRAAEFAVRTAVGGGRGRLLRQLLTESAVVAALGGLGGLLLAGWALDAIVGLMPADVPRAAEIAVNGRLLAFAACLVAVTALAFGSAPAVHALRRSAHGVLREQRTLARQHWPESDPLDQRVTVQLSGEAHAAEIVGVVGTVRPRGFESLPRPEVFLPHAQYPDGSMTYVVRTAGDPAAAIPAIQDVIWAAAPLETFYSVASVDQLLSDTLAARRFTTILVALFGIVALALATLGIYGVIAVATAQRTHEVGLRLALGAAPSDVRWMVVCGAVGLAGAGVAIRPAGFDTRVPLAGEPARGRDAVRSPDARRRVDAAAGRGRRSRFWSPARRAAATDPLAALRAE